MLAKIPKMFFLGGSLLGWALCVCVSVCMSVSVRKTVHISISGFEMGWQQEKLALCVDQAF